MLFGKLVAVTAIVHFQQQTAHMNTIANSQWRRGVEINANYQQTDWCEEDGGVWNLFPVLAAVNCLVLKPQHLQLCSCQGSSTEEIICLSLHTEASAQLVGQLTRETARLRGNTFWKWLTKWVPRKQRAGPGGGMCYFLTSMPSYCCTCSLESEPLSQGAHHLKNH